MKLIILLLFIFLKYFAFSQSDIITPDRFKVTDNNLLDTKPIFKGGEDKMYEFLNENIKFPQNPKGEKITGKTLVHFTITKKGKIKNVFTLESTDFLLDQEAIRLIKSMPKWIPGEKDGKKVNVSFTLPINFTLK